MCHLCGNTASGKAAELSPAITELIERLGISLKRDESGMVTLTMPSNIMDKFIRQALLGAKMEQLLN